MGKSIEEIRTINTKNLLRFYKAERKRMFNRGYRYMVIDEDKFCNPIIGWDNTSDSETFNDDVDFLYMIKMELNTREHVS
tara:strand:- start:408 stop:647 length:240 start_codon:yes stop_codon:yes gene_type:complete